MSAQRNGPDDSAQRSLEQRALRNVRGLVDRLDSMEQVDRRAQRRLFWLIVGSALVAMAVLAGVVMFFSAERTGGVIEIQAPRR